MKRTGWLVLLSVAIVMMFTTVFGQSAPMRVERRPAADAPASSVAPADPQVGGEAFHILDGLPTLIELHHDTEVGTNKPIDVYALVIEMQVMNSDGDREPIGLQLFNFFTKWPVEPAKANNPHNARDCRIWAGLQTRAMKNRDPKSKTWPYIEFTSRVGARVIQTNEDGAVYWSDDIECWGSSDRFPPF
ncbi:MAG: hypothetical protein WBD25_18775 [Terriglobales bacterium]|jgi:hypothetical protein